MQVHAAPALPAPQKARRVREPKQRMRAAPLAAARVAWIAPAKLALLERLLGVRTSPSASTTRSRGSSSARRRRARPFAPWPTSDTGLLTGLAAIASPRRGYRSGLRRARRHELTRWCAPCRRRSRRLLSGAVRQRRQRTARCRADAVRALAVLGVAARDTGRRPAGRWAAAGRLERRADGGCRVGGRCPEPEVACASYPGRAG